ncbi:hypothetical protein GCM10011529_10260 [Polymorphobacter glacialis]|uniref:Cytochrome c oxidase assembly protein n=1 Tax=Sandarakinorhabdus glacialis TaxID=1614636 RepID=A0A916ZN87_9SPHN|nr:cytochrome c oxidase assembly protein [Polymorphobacter glacialis]GGE05823.1 hypothetical protein GCM10011529_10260 [Polymorphobacter glacialis]
MRVPGGPPPTPFDWFSHWNLDPVFIAALALAWFIGDRRIGTDPERRGMLASATGVLAFLFVSPMNALTGALFSAHVVHQLALTTIVAPLLALTFPRTVRAPAWPAFLFAAVVFWAWHSPALYAAALGHASLYWVMQASMLVSAFAFWRAIFSPSEFSGAAVLVVASIGQMGLLGALLAFAPAPLYTAHMSSTAAWGIGPLADQQLAGLLMWVPGMLPYFVAGAALARRGWRLSAP